MNNNSERGKNVKKECQIKDYDSRNGISNNLESCTHITHVKEVTKKKIIVITFVGILHDKELK